MNVWGFVRSANLAAGRRLAERWRNPAGHQVLLLLLSDAVSYRLHSELQMGRRLRVLGLALAIRVAVLAAATLLDAWLPDYDSSSPLAYRTCSDRYVLKSDDTHALAEPRGWHKRLVVWDSVFFMQIAKCGYEYEQFHAFFPLLPLLMQATLQVGEARPAVRSDQHVPHILQYTRFARHSPSKKVTFTTLRSQPLRI